MLRPLTRFFGEGAVIKTTCRLFRTPFGELIKSLLRTGARMKKRMWKAMSVVLSPLHTVKMLPMNRGKA
jgi:hypothetical protein